MKNIGVAIKTSRLPLGQISPETATLFLMQPLKSEKAGLRRIGGYGGFMFMGAFADLGLDPQANAYAAEFVRNKIRATVKDPATAELLCPDTIIGCKRLCADTGYFETYNRDNVTLVDISAHPIENSPAAAW